MSGVGRRQPHEWAGLPHRSDCSTSVDKRCAFGFCLVYCAGN